MKGVTLGTMSLPTMRFGRCGGVPKKGCAKPAPKRYDVRCRFCANNHKHTKAQHDAAIQKESTGSFLARVRDTD